MQVSEKEGTKLELLKVLSAHTQARLPSSALEPRHNCLLQAALTQEFRGGAI